MPARSQPTPSNQYTSPRSASDQEESDQESTQNKLHKVHHKRKYQRVSILSNYYQCDNSYWQKEQKELYQTFPIQNLQV